MPAAIRFELVPEWTGDQTERRRAVDPLTTESRAAYYQKIRLLIDKKSERWRNRVMETEESRDYEAHDELLPRHLKGELVDALASSRVVNVVGPRQVGKTTLVRDLLGKGRYVTLDDEGVYAAIERDPLGQLEFLTKEAGPDPLIIDEAQRSPRLALAVKKLVDERRQMGQFILTGSSNVFTTAHVADSLAGRLRTLTLYPLSTAEMHDRAPARLLDWAAGRMGGGPEPTLGSLPVPPPVSRARYVELVVRGGFPELIRLDQRMRSRRHRSYVDSLVDRDVHDLLRIRKTDAMRRVVEQLAIRTGTLLNVSELCNLIGIQHSTLEQYLDVLTRLVLITRLGAWASGEARKEVRRPKVHMIDTGIVCSLRGLHADSFGPDGDPAALGGVLESFVHAELLKNLPYQDEEWRLFHFRNANQRELDIVAQAGRTVIGMEVKAGSTVNEDDFKHLRWFASEGPGARRPFTGIVFYLGQQPLAFSDRLFALPLSSFWAFEERAARDLPTRRRSAAGRTRSTRPSLDAA